MKQMIKHGWKVMVASVVLLLATWVVSSHSVAPPSSVEDLFKAKCALCHGADGAGKTTVGKALKARDLRSEDVEKQTDGHLKGIIAKGKNKMPSYSDKLTKEEIEQLVGYIRELAKH